MGSFFFTQNKMKLNKSSIIYATHFILACFTISWGLSNLYPIELFEFRLVEQSLSNWTTAPFVSRIYIGIMFFIGTAMLFNINPRNIITKLTLFCFAIPVFDLFWDAANSNEIIVGSYATIFKINKEFAYLTYLTAIAFCSFLLYKKANTDLKYRWIKYTLSLICLALPFVLNPVYPENFTDQSESISENVSLEELNYSNHTNLSENVIFAFFSTSCPYCILAAKKMQVAQKLYVDFPNVHVFFIGSKEAVEYFFKESNTLFPYSFPEQNSFFKIAGNSFPSFIYVENGIPKKRYTGRTFNYYAISNLSTL